MACLIAFVLLIVAAPSPLQNQQQHKAADHQAAAETVQPRPSQTTGTTATPREPAPSPPAGSSPNQPWNYSDAIAPSTWVNWLLALAAGIAAYVALKTLRAIGIQSRAAVIGIKQNRIVARAAKTSADAANKSAKAADLALHINRPFLVADKITFHDEAFANTAKLLKSQPIRSYFAEHPDIDPSAVVSVDFTLTNYGQGPAIVDSIVGCIQAIRHLAEIPIDDFSECEGWLCSRSVLGKGDSVYHFQSTHYYARN